MRKLISAIFLSILSFTSSAESKIKVALILPQTGKDTDFYCLGTAFASKADKSLFEFTFFDNENSASKTVEIAKKIAAGQFDIVIGTRTSQEALVAAPILAPLNIPFVVPIASHADISRNRPNVVRMVNSSDEYARLYAKFISTVLRSKRVAVVEDTSAPYSQFYSTNTVANLKILEPKVDTTTFKIFEGFKDFDKLSREISSLDPDLVYLPVYIPEALGTFDSLKRYQKNLTFLSHASINDGRQFLTSRVANQNKNLRFLFDGIWNGQLAGPHLQEYRNLMASCPGYSDSLRSVSSFDSLKLVLSVLSKKPNLRKKDLTNALKAEPFIGLMGSRNRKDGDPRMPLNLFELKGNQITFFKRFDGKQ